MEILYRVHNGIYVNLTNRCSAAWHVLPSAEHGSCGGEPQPRLERDPTAQEVEAAI